jgi:diacylglycerol kinase family enzyme
MASCSGGSSHFMETCSVGLISALSQSGDAIQHGNLAGLGDFLATLISSLPAAMELSLDGRRVSGSGHIALVTNMPFVGFHYKFGQVNAYRDGKLNVHFFNGLTKFDLIKYITGGVYLGRPKDPRISHFLAGDVDISAKPAMPVMVDGRLIGESPVHITVLPKALHVMCGR